MGSYQRHKAAGKKPVSETKALWSPKKQSCSAVTTQRRTSQNEFPSLWLTCCRTCQSLAIATLRQHGSDMAGKKTSNHLLKEERIWKNVQDREKTVWFMKLDGAYQQQANSEETSSWQSKIQTGSLVGTNWQLIPVSSGEWTFWTAWKISKMKLKAELVPTL